MIMPGWPHSTQILQWVLSYDFKHSPEPLAITAAGAAMALSEVPTKRAVAGVRVGMIDGRFVVNPTLEQMEESKLDLVMAGTKGAVSLGCLCISKMDWQTVPVVHVALCYLQKLC